MNPHIYSQPIFDKLLKTTQWGKDNLHDKWCWDNWTSTRKGLKTDPYLTPYAKINSERTNNLY